MDFAARLSRDAARIETMLDTLLSDVARAGEIARPSRLVAAMRHASLDGGKRLRPFLVMETARLFGIDDAGSARAAAAIECVHCYSLVHDDLPAMDDDDMRRGRPTVHKAYDEATAILAGDALLTYAFDILSDPDTHPDAAIRVALVARLAHASGLGGMAGGQMLDLAAEGRPLNEAEIVRLQAMKTGALLQASVAFGAILGGADGDSRDCLERFGAAIGGAFQLADDLLDLEADPGAIGKATGKDAARGKATLVSLLGPDEARARLAGFVEAAHASLDRFGPEADVLRETARFIAERGH